MVSWHQCSGGSLAGSNFLTYLRFWGGELLWFVGGFGVDGDDDGWLANRLVRVDWIWRDDVQVDAMMLDLLVRGGSRGRDRGSSGLAEDAFAFELEFLAFEIEGGEFLDAGENIFHDVGAGISAGEVKGFLLEEMADGVLDARGLLEFGVDFHVRNDVEHVFGEADFVARVPVGAEATESDDADFEAETFGRRRGDAVVNVVDAFEFANPFVDLTGLFVVERTKEGIGALAAGDGFEATVQHGFLILRCGGGEDRSLGWSRVRGDDWAGGRESLSRKSGLNADQSAWAWLADRL